MMRHDWWLWPSRGGSCDRKCLPPRGLTHCCCYCCSPGLGTGCLLHCSRSLASAHRTCPRTSRCPACGHGTAYTAAWGGREKAQIYLIEILNEKQHNRLTFQHWTHEHFVLGGPVGTCLQLPYCFASVRAVTISLAFVSERRHSWDTVNKQPRRNHVETRPHTKKTKSPKIKQGKWFFEFLDVYIYIHMAHMFRKANLTSVFWVCVRDQFHTCCVKGSTEIKQADKQV